MKILFILIISVITLFSQELKKVSIQLPWMYQFQFAGYIIAKEKGYYKDANLDVAIKEIDFDLPP